MRPVLRVAWYRFRATFRRRWGGYLSIVLLVGLVGGLALGSVAGARRNQSAYPAFLASTRPSELALPTALYGLNGAKSGYNAQLVAKIARLPHVRRVGSSVEINGGPVDANGKLLNMPANFNIGSDASPDGVYVDQDRVTVTRGRMFNRARADEIVVSAGVAKVLAADGIHLGGVMHLVVFSDAQLLEPLSVQLTHAYRRIDVRLVGIGLLNSAVIQDDVDVIGSEFYMFTPAFTRQFLQCCVASTVTHIALDGGSRYVRATEARLEQLNPLLNRFSVGSSAAAKVERAVRPESIAFGFFGLIAALAAFLIATQLIGRQLLLGADDRNSMRALGASPAMALIEGLIGVVGAVVVGALVAGMVAVGLSWLSPIGPVRRIYPFRGIAFDWTVLGTGIAALIVGLTAVSVALAYRTSGHRAGRRPRLLRLRRSTAAQIATTAGASAPVATGVRFALEPGRGRNTVPVRSAILGAALAIIVVVSTVTFGASLRALVSHPPLYGWNWNYELAGGSGVGAIPQRQSATLLNHDRDIAAWTGIYFATLNLDGHTEPVITGTPGSIVQPPLLSGHAFNAANQIVLGVLTLAQLHKHVGDRLTVTGSAIKPTRLQIVGTATMPAIGAEGNPTHPTMGAGALLSSDLIPASVRDTSGNRPAGPNAILVRLRNGVQTSPALRTLNQIATKLSLPTNWGVEVLAVQRPAEIVNYRSMTNTPIILGGALALSATGALGLTLVTSVRRRRRELALLKTLGFTRRQLAAVIAWQSSIAVSIGVIIGVPLGIIAGRSLWDLFARAIHAVPQATVPPLTIMFIAIGALVLANLVAAIPGLQAARTRTALLLHAE